MVRTLQEEMAVTNSMTPAEPRMVRFSLGLFALAALAMLLAAAWLRFFVPMARPAQRVRDVSWLQQPER